VGLTFVVVVVGLHAVVEKWVGDGDEFQHFLETTTRSPDLDEVAREQLTCQPV